MLNLISSHREVLFNYTQWQLSKSVDKNVQCIENCEGKSTTKVNGKNPYICKVCIGLGKPDRFVSTNDEEIIEHL